MTFSFHTLGCKLNFAESSSIAKQLVENGHTRVPQSQPADICIINTCSVTDAADHKGRQAIHHIRKLNPNATLIVTGCYAQLKPGEIISMPQVDFVLGANDKFSIPSLIHNIESHSAPQPTTLVSAQDKTAPFFPSYSKDDRTRCFLKIQDGCDYFCTYCTIPFARGRSRNNSIEKTIQQVNQALAEGAKEIVLTGVNIGDFGKSTGETFFELIKAIDSIDSQFRVRISSCEPNLLTDQIIQFVSQSNHFTPHFHIPLQSGTDQMLRIMHRRYNTQLFKQKVEYIKQLMPHAFIGVDCMVGVRGETPELFQQYYDFISSLDISALHVFTYSERQNTYMLKMDLPIVPPKEKKERSDILHQLSTRKLNQFYQNNKGYHATVLWEAKKENNLMAGFTENYIKVFQPYDKNLVNTFQPYIC
ncbi:MAG: tRNA (N(6)-L-threonylcarbamoyladenosine(37)-C(2))-methylthiotransferase MtaB [Paludibacteraceae bacterium]|nr:tRNA (N(6)-L-threonylcarbamoyladenosine(37)-C(2))-methylthiotransferase MtaB [Paludibacteraceae bacterium]